MLQVHQLKFWVIQLIFRIRYSKTGRLPGSNLSKLLTLFAFATKESVQLRSKLFERTPKT